MLKTSGGRAVSDSFADSVLNEHTNRRPQWFYFAAGVEITITDVRNPPLLDHMQLGYAGTITKGHGP